MDFLSGDLDRVFTALYELGMIEPMLEKNWTDLYKKAGESWTDVSTAIQKLNRIHSLKEIRQYLESLSQPVIEALVIEVAREMAAFHERQETIH